MNRIIRQRMAARKRRLARRLDKHFPEDLSRPMLGSANVEYELAGRGTGIQWNADWQAQVGIEDGQYVVEFAIPHAALGTTAPKPGEKWALNVLRGRGPRDPKWELFSQWVMTYADFQSSSHLGTLHFE